MEIDPIQLQILKQRKQENDRLNGMENLIVWPEFTVQIWNGSDI